MQKELIFMHEGPRVVHAASECCAEVYGDEPDSLKCQKLSMRMKVCLDLSSAIAEDAFRKGIYMPGATPTFGDGLNATSTDHNHPLQGMISPMGMGFPFYGGIHPMLAMMYPFLGGIHPMHAMMSPLGMGLPFYGGIHPMHAMMHPFFGGIHPFRAMMHPMSKYGGMGLGGMGSQDMETGDSSRRQGNSFPLILLGRYSTMNGDDQGRI
ncbi:hypothetical protein RF11_02277 [Thelohanellus kitauei]|uniref:Uncharacterized protein n=1 Tax=Thelohanellus kitauei TaxID=669202 RepID=A0A0C2J312_THEKT|nr:hypothetical protein RF11_02277 [Thelohanellus kitauei]